MGTWEKGLEDGQSSGRKGKVAGGRAKQLEDGQSSGRTGQDMGQGKEGRAKGRGAGNVMDGLGQAVGLLGGVTDMGKEWLAGPF